MGLILTTVVIIIINIADIQGTMEPGFEPQSKEFRLFPPKQWKCVCVCVCEGDGRYLIPQTPLYAENKKTRSSKCLRFWKWRRIGGLGPLAQGG